MPHFVFRGTDKPQSEALRASLREAHRAYIRCETEDCRTVLGGPLLRESDQQMFATLLVLEAEDRDAALRFLAADPYARAGLFVTTSLDRWHWGLGQPEPPGGDQRG